MESAALRSGAALLSCCIRATAFALTRTGSRGLHVVMPLKRRESFDSVRSLARKQTAIIASQAALSSTRIATLIQRVAPPYAVRARRSAPVSTPLSWRELGSRQLRPETIPSIIK
jgi:bifunctional non-homologous end joining protein LigD